MVHKMKTLEEVLYDYTRGEKTLEEANKALRSWGAGSPWTPPAISSPPGSCWRPGRERRRTRPTAGAFWTTVWAAWKRSMW